MNQQKIPLARSLDRFAQAKINDAFQRAGQALPCSVVSVSGAIVTVRFEINSTFTLPNVAIPLVGAEYIRYPIQVGDKGVVFPADARLSGVSGIGGGVADLSQPGNLTALVFLPTGNTAFTPVDSQAVVIYGPNGVVLRDTGDASNITITPSGIVMMADEISADANSGVSLRAGGDFDAAADGSATISGTSGASVTSSADADVTASGTLTLQGASVDIVGTLTINGKPFLLHDHIGVMSGPSVTGPVGP